MRILETVLVDWWWQKLCLRDLSKNFSLQGSELGVEGLEKYCFTTGLFPSLKIV